MSGISIDLADLKRKSVRGGMVTFGSQGVSIIIQLASTVILARLLTPDDYGTIAMVAALTAFAGLFRDLGLSSAAIQKKDLTDAQQSNLFWLNVAMGAALTAIVAAASPLVAWFYGRPELVPVTIALSFGFLIGSLGAQHTARLTRDMQFGRKAAATLSGSLVTLAVAVACALNGLAYWSLVWGNLAGGVVATFLLFLLSPFWPGFYKKGAGIRAMLDFGAKVTAFDLVNYFQRNLDNILIGRVWGAGELGLYGKAYSLLMLPINSIRGPINAVAFPVLARLQDRPDDFRDYYLKTTSLIALLSMPMAAFLFVIAEPLVALVLGPGWHGVAPIFSWLALAAFIQPTSGFAGSLLLGLGQGGRYLACGSFNALIICFSFVIGVRWGAVGVAIAYAIANYVVLYPWLAWAYRRSPVRFSMFVRACRTPAIFSIAAALACKLMLGDASTGNPWQSILMHGALFAMVISPILFSATSRRAMKMLRN